MQRGVALLPVDSEGDYFFYLVVSKRLLHIPVRPENSSPRFDKWKSDWNSPKLEEPCCVSQSIPVHVDKSGGYHLAAKDSDKLFRHFEIDPSVNPSGVIRSRFWIIFDHETDLSVFRCNLAEDSDGPEHWNLVRSDWAPFIRLARPIAEKSYFREVSDRVRVPQWGIVGGTRSGIAIPELPGQHTITAEIDESLYWDRVYYPQTNARRQPPQKVWPIVFCSEPRVVEVPTQVQVEK